MCCRKERGQVQQGLLSSAILYSKTLKVRSSKNETRCWYFRDPYGRITTPFLGPVVWAHGHYDGNADTISGGEVGEILCSRTLLVFISPFQTTRPEAYNVLLRLSSAVGLQSLGFNRAPAKASNVVFGELRGRCC